MDVHNNISKRFLESRTLRFGIESGPGQIWTRDTGLTLLTEIVAARTNL